MEFETMLTPREKSPLPEKSIMNFVGKWAKKIKFLIRPWTWTKVKIILTGIKLWYVVVSIAMPSMQETGL